MFSLAVIAEIEQLWCFPCEARRSKYSPRFVYYVAKIADVRNQRKMVKDQCARLIEDINREIQEKKDWSLEDYERNESGGGVAIIRKKIERQEAFLAL